MEFVNFSNIIIGINWYKTINTILFPKLFLLQHEKHNLKNTTLCINCEIHIVNFSLVNTQVIIFKLDSVGIPI